MKTVQKGISLTTYTDKQNLNLLVRINKSRQLHLVPCTLNGKYVLRFSVNYEFATPEMISKFFSEQSEAFCKPKINVTH